MLTQDNGQVVLDRGDAVLRGAVHETGPTVVLLHAGRENRHVWDPVIAEIQAHVPVRCLSIDQRGHGESTGERNRFAPLVDDLVDLLGRWPGPTILVGCSLGGLAAVGAVADPTAAHAVLGIVLVDVVPDLRPGPVWAFLGEAGLLPEAEPIAHEILAAARDLHRTMATFAGQAALVRAEASAMTDGDVQRFRDARPAASIIEISGAGHLVARDQPAALAAVLADLVAAWSSTATPRISR